MKYIIRNCPAYRTECEEIFNFLGSEKIFNACLKSAGISCKDITDCLLKKIVEFVKWRDEESVCNSCGLGIPHRKEEFQRILNMLEIEECE